MNLKSILKPENSVLAGIATAALVYGAYQINLGSVAVAHATPANNGALQTSRKKAAWESVIAVSGISLLTRDITIFVLGGATVTALDWHYRHAIAADHATGQLVPTDGFSQPVATVQPGGSYDA